MQIGAYEVLGEIARGGAGVVYRARHMTHATPVAIKVLQLQSTPDFVERFRREAHVTFRLRHPHVVGLLEWGQHQAHPYLVLELIEGQSLEERLRQGPLPARQIFQLGRQIADALHYAHGLGLVHRDIKPANILLEARTGRAVLTDFGIAQVEGASGERLTVTGEVLGTPAFMSPEQARGTPGDMGPLSDVYSLGATLYAALSGRPPVTETSPIAAMAQVMTEAPPHPKDVYPAAHPELTELVLRCLEKTPNDRFPNAAALRDALTDASRTGTVGATGANRVVERRRSPALIALTAAALAALGGLGLGRLTAPTASPAPTPVVNSDDPPPPADAEPATEQDAIWFPPYTTLLQLQERAQQTDEWVDHARLAKHCNLLDEPRLALQAIEAALVAHERVDGSSATRALLLFVRGQTKLILLDEAGALADAEQLVELAPDAKAHSLHSRALDASGEPESAMQAIDRALELSPGWVEATLHRAIVLRHLGRHDEAYEELAVLRTRGLHSTDLLLVQEGTTEDLARRAELLEAAADQRPDAPKIWRQLAAVRAEQEEWLLVQQSATRAYYLDSNDFASALFLWDAFEAQGSWKNAAALGRSLLLHAPDRMRSLVNARLAHDYSRLPNPPNDAILRHWKDYRSSQQDEILAFRAYAGMLAAKRHYVDLLALLAPLPLHPNNAGRGAMLQPDPELYYLRSLGERAQRNEPQAHFSLTQAQQLSRQEEGPFQADRGAIFLRQGLPLMALESFAKQGGDPKLARRERAAALLLLGDYAAAARAYEALPQPSPASKYGLARALRASGDEPAALDVLRNAFPGSIPAGASSEVGERAALKALKLKLGSRLRGTQDDGLLAEIDALLLLEPREPDLYLIAAGALAKLPESQALSDYVLSILNSHDERTPNYLSTLAVILRPHRPGLACVLFREALRRDPTHEEANLSLTELYFNMGLSEAAEQLATTALTHFPGRALPLAFRGLARAQLGRPQAEIDLRAALTAGGLGNYTDVLNLELARLVTSRGGGPDAHPFLEAALASRAPSIRLGALICAAGLEVLSGDTARTKPKLDEIEQLIKGGAAPSAPDCRLLTKIQRELRRPR